MNISRRGSAKNYGHNDIEITSPSISWSTTESSLKLQKGNVKDFSSGTRHRYTISITANEINEFLAVIARAAMNDPKSFETQFQPSLKPLIQLQSIISGIKT